MKLSFFQAIGQCWPLFAWFLARR